MFLTPDAFIEKYLKDRLPYFKIYRGGQLNEKHVMDRLMEFQSELDTDGRLAIGEEKLRDFFDKYPDGYVTIICKKGPKEKDEYSNTNSVKWGEKQQGQSMKEAIGNTGGISQMKQMMELMLLMQNVMRPQDTTSLQIEMLRNQHALEIAQLKKQVKWDKERDELIGALQGEPPSVGETIGQELIGLIKPVATAFLAKSAAMPPAPLPVVNGMERTVEKKPKQKAPAPSTGNATHPMMNVSVDLSLQCVRAIMEGVFPDYNVNEVMPALAKMCGQHRDIIRQFVIPQIEANRQAQAAKKPYPGTNDEEE